MLSGIAASVGLLPWVSTTTATASSATASTTNSVADPFSTRIPEFPSDPHIVTSHGVPPLLNHLGWEAVNRDVLVDSILDLDPGVFNSQALTGFTGPPLETNISYRHQATGLFSKKYNLPHSLGFHPYVETNTMAERWYYQLPENRKWMKPDGTLVTHPKEIASRDYYGGPHAITPDGSTILPSVFAPGTFDRMVRTASQIYQLGVTHMWIDGLGFARLKGNDFSEWAQTAFRDHLDSLSDRRLAALNISNPSTFDITAHLREEGLDPPSTDHPPATNPAYREYTRFQHRYFKQFLSKLANQSQAAAPPEVISTGTRFFGNLGGLSSPMPAAIYASDVADTIVVEADPTVPPTRPNDITVKIARAAGRFKKPVQLVGKLHKIREMDTLTGLDPRKQYPMLMKFQVAQSYAHAGIRALSLTSWADVPNDSVVNNWIQSDGSIDQSLKEFTDFVRIHERYLDDVEEANRAVLVVSLPTLIWQRAPQWKQYLPSHSKAIRAAATVLRREHIPYDVLILDEPSLWNAPDQHQRLREYDLAVLPGVEVVSDAHIEAVEGAINTDTTVVATGGGPSRDLEYQPRSELKEILRNEDTATVLTESPTQDSADPGTRSLHDALPTKDRQVSLDTDDDVSVNVLRQSGKGRVIVHLVNFEYDPESDSMPTQPNLDVVVRKLPFTPAAATYISPDGTTDLDIELNKTTASVTVPELQVWGFIVLDANTSTSQDVSESTAADRLENARATLENARMNDRTVCLEPAEASLTNAEQAFDAGSYLTSESLSDAAITAAQKAYQRPVVGIDVAHNQSEATYDASLSQLRTTFDTYHYQELTAWTTDSFEAVDVLVVPPLNAESTAQFEVASSELAALEEFVRTGGSLLLLGMGGAKAGLNRVAKRFGFEFDLRPVLREIEGDMWAHRVESPLSEITHFVPDWQARFGTVLQQVGNATVLGRIAADQKVWLHSQEPLNQRTSDEPDASGKPVMAGARVGAGHIIVSGETQQFVNPKIADGTYPGPLPQNVLETLGRMARLQRRENSSTDTTSTSVSTTSAASTTASSETQQSTTADAPGFTAPLAAFASTLAMIRYAWAEYSETDE